MPTDEHQLWMDERAAQLRARDRQREPVGLPPVRAGVAPPPRTVRLTCPSCRGWVFTASDSNHEFVDCTSCPAELVTRRLLDGTVDVVPVERAP